MSQIVKEEIIHVFTTPEELRKMADELEAKCKRSFKLGEDVPSVWIVSNGGKLSVKFAIDQDKVKL